jgi:CRISPR-associated protein Cmr6
MLNAAVPAYLGDDFKDTSPGMRFGAYLRLWDAGWAKPKAAKIEAVLDATSLTRDDLSRIKALQMRQSAQATPLAAQGHLLTLDAIATAPFTTGLGNEHPLENGFAFLNPYGLPYLPGSGVKGVLRQAARELASGEWGEAQGWSKERKLNITVDRQLVAFSVIDALFGLESQDGDKHHLRGALSFWDVLPQLDGDSLQVEVMTPHQSHYYQPPKHGKAAGDSTNPHDSGQPNPIHFLTIPPLSKFTFHVQCDVPFLTRLAPELAEANRWQGLLQAAFEHAFTWLGFGAKTAVGYGAMKEDEQARERQRVAQEKAKAEAESLARAKALAEMSPDDAAWAQAQPVVDDFRAELAKAKAAGAYNPGGGFNQVRQSFLKTALAWTEARSRRAAGEVLAESATKAWGRPSNKDRWAELQAAIAALTPP